MGWGVAPDRYLLPNRSWMPHWRFQPTVRLDDAFKLLDWAKPQACSIHLADGNFTVKVQISGRWGQSIGKSGPVAITLALATALGIEVSRTNRE
jgi:hypothetical protein